MLMVKDKGRDLLPTGDDPYQAKVPPSNGETSNLNLEVRTTDIQQTQKKRREIVQYMAGVRIEPREFEIV